MDSFSQKLDHLSKNIDRKIQLAVNDFNKRTVCDVIQEAIKYAEFTEKMARYAMTHSDYPESGWKRIKQELSDLRDMLKATQRNELVFNQENFFNEINQIAENLTTAIKGEK